MSNVYCRAMSVLGCQPAALKIRKSCTQDCCDGENCISWFDKQFSRLAAYEDSGLTPEQVQELAKAKADGRLKILPAKPCDIIYRPEALQFCWMITKVEIYEDEIVFIDDSDNIFRPDDIGKTVFLTREEAEKALKEACT